MSPTHAHHTTPRPLPPPRHARPPCPFTLVEVLLAVSILAFGMVGVIAAYIKSSDTLRIAQDNVEAYSLLKEKMSEFELTVHTSDDVRGLMGTEEGDFRTGYRRQYSWKRDVEAGPTDRLVKTVVTVTHKRSGRTYALGTFFRVEPAEDGEEDPPQT